MSQEDDLHRCPICNRENGSWDEDFCEHYWGTIYDNELLRGPYDVEYEKLWGTLESVYQDLDHPLSSSILQRLREAGLDDVAKALEEDNKFWWLDISNAVFIDAKASLASGTGYFLYDTDLSWFDTVLQKLRRGNEVCRDSTS